MRTPVILPLLVSLLPGVLHGQDFTPSMKFLGDLRVRGEVDSRDFNLSTPPNSYTLLRTRFGLEARPSEKVRVFIMARDSRVFGSETDAAGTFNTISDSKNLDLHQGYVEIGKFLSDEITFRVGRQELGYAGERMVGPVGWNNVGRVFDGGLLNFASGDVTVDLFGMKTAGVHTYAPVATPAATAAAVDNGQNFFGLYTQWKTSGGHREDVYLFFQGNRTQTSAGGFQDFRRITAGGYAKGPMGEFLYEAECAYQGGDRGTSDIAAYMITGLVGYSPPGSTLSQVAAGYEFLSGTAPGETDYRSFEPLYATGHKFHGFMDYFINIPAQTGNLGLRDILGKVMLNFSDRAGASIWYHRFNLAEKGGGGDDLGHEIDITGTFRYSPAVSFEAGFCAFLPGEVMRARFAGSDAGLWGYLATAVTF
ncbi:MAG TPA: alginate export family protein [Bacteroidota bacterium]|nr:alginate export family protein [Bacteroidota bacterium]